MNRCLDCGTERDTDQCPGCGLTSLAAEVMLRRRLVRRTALFLVGAVIFVPASQAFPPLEVDGIMIFVGVLFFLVLGLGLWMVNRARRGGDIEIVKRIYFGLLPVPWILTALLFINGKFDPDPPKRVTAAVVGKFSMPGFLRTQRLVVTSWRDGRQIERVLVSRDDYQPVLITTEMAHKVPLLVRTMLGTNLHGLGFSVRYQKFDESLWFPVSYGTEFRVRALFFYNRSIVVSLENTGFRRAKIDSVISFDEPQ